MLKDIYTINGWYNNGLVTLLRNDRKQIHIDLDYVNKGFTWYNGSSYLDDALYEPIDSGNDTPIQPDPQPGGDTPTVTKYNITVSNNTGGSISTNKSKVEYGGSATITIIINDEYKLNFLTINSINVTAHILNNLYVINNITEDKTVYAEFSKNTLPTPTPENPDPQEPDPQDPDDPNPGTPDDPQDPNQQGQFTVYTLCTPQNGGNILTNKTSVEYGGTVYFKPVAESGYTIKSLYVNGNNIIDQVSITSINGTLYNYHVSNVTSDLLINAEFTNNYHSLGSKVIGAIGSTGTYCACVETGGTVKIPDNYSIVLRFSYNPETDRLSDILKNNESVLNYTTSSEIENGRLLVSGTFTNITEDTLITMILNS